MSAEILKVIQEMRERKVNHGRGTSPALEAWADRLEAALSQQAEPAEPSGPARYRVDPAGRGFWPFCVRAGDGTRELFVGHRKTCERVAAELAVAFEDGKFAATRSGTPGVPSPKKEAVESALRSAREFIAEQPVRTTSIGANGQIEGVRMDEGNYRIIRLLDKIDCALEKLTEADQNGDNTR